MLSSIPLPLAFNLGTAELFVLFIPAVAIIFGGVMATVAMYFKNRERQMWHETARLALEKGQPVPPLAGQDAAARYQEPGRNDLRVGLILVAVGFGLFLWFQAVAENRGVAYLGAIPGFIGAALLVHWLIARITNPRSDVPPRQP